MDEVDFNWLFIILTHFLNAHFISVLLIFIGESPQELSELLTNELNDFWLLNPSWKILLLLRVIIHIAQILLLVLILALHHLLSLPHFSHWHLRIAVLTIRHKSSWLSLLTSLHQSPLSINFTLSLSACFSIYNLLICIVDAFIFIAVKFRSFFVITLKKKKLKILKKCLLIDVIVKVLSIIIWVWFIFFILNEIIIDCSFVSIVIWYIVLIISISSTAKLLD